MEEDVLSALRSRAVYLPGCSDRDGRVLVVVNVPNDLQQAWSKRCLEACINYIRKSLSPKLIKAGLTVILDGEKYSTRVTKSQCRTIGMLFEDSLAQLILVRAEGFWDKHIDHCAKNHSQGEPIVITKSRLSKYFEMNELPNDLGGKVAYNHDRWLQNRVRIEEFHAKYDKTTSDLESLHTLLLSHKSLNPSEVSQAMKSCEELYTDVQLAITRTIEMGNQLTANINDCYRVPSSSSIDFHKMPQDIAGELETITDLLNEIEKKQSGIRCAWNDLEKTIHEARELLILEKGVAFVIKWIMGIADKKLNRDTRVGCDIASCEELRRDNDLLDMQCQEVYAYCAELIYKIEANSSYKDSPAYKELLSQRDFMDFVCRNFAARLERRRSILVSSLRFFRLVSEYFDRTSEVFESLVMGYKADDFELAATNLEKLKDCQSNLENMEKDLVREGKRLIDMLSMPVKDSLGRDIGVDYNDDIANVRDILDVTMARRNIFIDSVELQKLTLEQVAHIHEYEKDAKIAIKCMEDLYSTLIRCHSHVGCTVFEIQIQKEELQTFQETGKGIHNLGCQLLEAALSLRHTCKLKLETKSNNSLKTKLRQIWTNLEIIIQENMTRLRVSAVFHRNVEDYCVKLLELKANVIAIGDIEEPETRRVRLRMCLVLRERLLVEVGRMVRLGRLLKSRLKEPFVLENVCFNDIENGSETAPELPSNLPEGAETVVPAGGNSIACSAISSKISEVADAAESLDAALNGVQKALDDLDDQQSNEMEPKAASNHNSSTDDLNCSVQSTEDESYASASEYNGTMQSSRSSSYHTASEHRTSPWWGMDKSSVDECSEMSTETPPTLQTSGIMSGNTSFDSSELSFRTVQNSPEPTSEKSEKVSENPLEINNQSEENNLPEKSVKFKEMNDAQKNDDKATESNDDGPVPEYEGDRATLIIPEAYPKDAGVYLVTAKNIAGEAYSTCNVSVKGRLPNETSDSEMASDMEPIKPSVQLSLKDVSVFEGKSVRLDCVIVGQPEPEVIWYHNDRPVKESADVQLLFQGDRCSLVIQEAYLEDAGAYKVVAINSAGEASSSCNLSVTPLNIAEHATRTQVERLIPVESPPKFEKFLTDVLANEGETVELECSVIGDSPLTAKWYLSNRELYETDRIKSKCEPGGVFKLIISNVNADDKGVYTVKVSNSSGDAKCFSHLIVKSVNAPDSQQRPPQLEPEEKFICPTFKELFSDRNAHLDDTVKFECIVVGKPTPKIRWYFNDLPVHGKHFLVSTSGDRQVLTVQAACPETVGKIACIAENEIGKATCVANLGLIGQPVGVQQQQPSSTANVQSITEEHNTDSSLVTIKKQMFTTTSTSQISTVQNGIPQTQLHETVQRVDKDFKQFGEQKPEIVESHQYQEFRTKDSVPVAIQQKSIVVVQKSGDEMEPPPHKIVRKQIAPRFMSPLVGKIVDQGADVNLEAIYDGFPSPEIKVQKNGEDLFDTDRVKILKELNKVKINLSGVGVRDAGRYSITVTNAAGSSTSTADVVVKKTIFPPVFGHRLQAQVAKRGERVIMDVEVTGTPDPTITWYKDNKPLKEVMRSPYKLKDEGNSHTLVIEKVQTADSGKYMVKATNAGGEAQSIADFAVLEPTPERMVEVVKTVVYDDMKDFKQETSKPESSSFHTKSVETSTKSDSHGSSESTIITEHRCTTEATMRMEHKPSFLDLPVLSKPVPKPPTGDHESKSVSVNTDIVQSKFGATQTMPQPPPKSTDESSSIETSSITKKSAFEYFKSIQSEPVPATDEKYTRFEDIKKPSSLPPAHPIKPTPPPEKPPTLKENLPKFDLTPGAPPEYGFIPKPETVKTIDHLTDRIKKLEESQKTHIDVPSGGIKTLPEINRREEHTMYSKASTYEFSSAPIYRPQAALPTPTISGDRSPSPKPSAEGVAMEKLWASPKPFENDKIHLERDQDSQGRKQFSCTESDNEYQHTEESMRSSSIKETKQIFEEKIKQASKEEELKAPALVKQYCPPPPEPPKPIPETLLDIKLEPGPPPEICYAPKPVLERKQSLVETIEQKLEKDLEKEPAKVLPHSVRIIPPPKREVPPPLPPKDFDSPIPTTTEKRFEEVKFQSEIHRVSKPPPPTVPPKLAKGEYYESDYESDKWKFSESESDEPAYRSVKPPQFTSHPPSAVSHVPKPFVSGIQPQPVACEIPKPKPISGYIADTEESAYRKSEYHQSSSVQTSKKMYESYQQQSEPLPAKFYRHHQIRSSYPEEPVQMFPKDYSASSFTRNISMTTKNLKEVKEEEPQLEPFPFKPDPPRPRPAKVPPPPSPSKFIKGEFRESDYGSDYEEKIPPIWKPYDSDSSEPKGYRPIRPLLTPTGRRSAQSASGESPIPPTQFDNPPKFDGPPRPKFEPIKNEQPVTSQHQSQVFKPKPVQARFVPTQQQLTPQQRPNYTTQYYTAIAGTPLHNASMATETRKTVQMRESNETCNRVVNMSQTHRVIHFDNKKSSQEPPLEPFPYTASPTFTSPRPRVQLPTPTKFVPGEFRDSDFENEVDSVRIRPVWTPNPSDSEEPQYRRVNPPRPSRSSSLPRTYGRVLTPMEFDTYPPEMPGKSPTESAQSYYTNQSYKSNTMQNYSTQRTYETRTTRDDMNLKVGSPPKSNYTSQVNHQMKDFGSTLRSKSNKFVESISNDLKSTHSVRPGFKRAPSEGDNKPQAYREESRVSQYGTKHIDPDTGLVYFKYDFGYEFGIIFPGEGKKIIGGSQSKSLNESFGSKAAAIRNLKGDIVIPVQHERTSSSRSVSRQNGFTSEGEFSEPEYDGHAKKRFSLPLDINIDRLHASDANNLISRKTVAESNSTVPVNAHLLREDRPKRPPIFITPLKDIAVVMGQTARFECIVQCDPHPQITWAKNGFPLQPSNKHVIEFRNGVCRLTIPEAYPDDAATYTCQGVNELGSATTSADLLVPGNKCGIRY